MSTLTKLNPLSLVSQMMNSQLGIDVLLEACFKWDASQVFKRLDNWSFPHFFQIHIRIDLGSTQMIVIDFFVHKCLVFDDFVVWSNSECY